MRLINAFYISIVFLLNPAYADNNIHRPLLEKTALFKGHLGYLDYRSGEKVSIPMTLSFTESADQRHLVVDKVYTDPSYKVYAMSVLNIDFVNKTVDETTFNKEGKDFQSFELVEFNYKSAENWSMTRKTVKADDDRDALVTIIEAMVAGKFTSETRVDYFDTAINDNLRRNWVVASKESI